MFLTMLGGGTSVALGSAHRLRLRLLIPIYQRIPQRPVSNKVSSEGRDLTEIPIVRLVETSGFNNGDSHGGVGDQAAGEGEAGGASTHDDVVVSG